MSEHYQGVKEDGTLTLGFLSLKTNSKRERESILKEYLKLSGAVKLVKVYDNGPCYEEVTI